MKEVMRLIKLFLNNSWGISQLLYNRKHNKKAYKRQLMPIIIVPIALILTYGMYLTFMSSLYIGLKTINQSSVYLSIGYVFITIMILVFGFMYIFSEFYFSKSMDELMTLPIKPRKIIVSKFISILVIQYFFVGIAFVPMLIIFGVGEGLGLGYAILSLLVFLTIPVFPLAIETLVIMLIMKSFALKGKKDILNIVYMFLIIGVIFGVQFFMRGQLGSIGADNFQDALTNLLTNEQGLLMIIIQYIPLSILVAWSLNQITLLSIIWIGCFILISLMGSGLMVFIGEKIYFSSLINAKNSKKGKKLSAQAQKKELGKMSHQAMSVFKMDMRLLLRTPVYFFNNLSVIIIVPIYIVFSLSFMQLTLTDLSDLNGFYKEMPMLINFIFIAFFAFFGGTATTTATTFSREGKGVWLTRIIPVSAKDQIIGRTASALIIQSLGMIFTLICVFFYLKLTVSSIMIIVFIGLLGISPILLFGLFIDMRRPLLDWDNPQKAVKNNMNALITLFVGMAYEGISIGISGTLGYFVNPFLGYGVYCLISVTATIILYKVVNNNLEKRLLEF
jgi:ABC-2 type transport system permease protein